MRTLCSDCAQGVLRMCSGCAQDVFRMCSSSIQIVPSLYANCAYIAFNLCLYHVQFFPHCAQIVLRLCSNCAQFETTMTHSQGLKMIRTLNLTIALIVVHYYTSESLI